MIKLSCEANRSFVPFINMSVEVFRGKGDGETSPRMRRVHNHVLYRKQPLLSMFST